MIRSALAAALVVALAACSSPSTETAPPQAAAPAAATPEDTAPVNALLAASTLPMQAPPFDKIKDGDYQPAIEEGMRQQLVEIGTIADDSAEPTFANTIEAMDKTGELLSRSARIFFGLVQANTNDTLQAAQVALAPKLAEHGDAIHLNAKLFKRVKAVYDARETSNLDPVQMRLVEKTYVDFVRAGAQLNDADQTTLRALNKEESTLSTDFQNKLLAGTNEGGVVVDDEAQLDGLGDGGVAAAADAAKERKLGDGKYLLPLQNTTQQPVLGSLTNRDLRLKVLEASETRTSHGDANDTRVVIQRLAQLRAERAKLLGYPNFAAYSLADQMAETPEHAVKLMTDMVPAATARARSEAAKIQKVIDAQKGGFKLTAADWDLYADQVRKAEYDLDEAAIKPYFELNRVLNDGVFFAANQLYGLTFKERHDLPVYQPDVRVFDVFDADGQQLALFYADYYKRPSKSGGAWMDVFVEQNGLTGTKPVVYNVCNFTKPADGQPALLSFDDVTTMFHEFGHALHGMFSNVKYPSVAGTSTSRDFVEFPSQFNENWALEPKVFANYAKHNGTGEPMPQALVDKIIKARAFNQGYATVEYLGAALLDQAWHQLGADAPLQDVDKFETDALNRYKINVAEVPPRYKTPYFAHIWGGGYSAGYYAYLWSEVLDHDAFQWFKENGGMSRANGQTFRDKVLSRGNSEELAKMYKEFRGKDPSVEPLLEFRGLK
ncbi:MAG TPA: M3 family metallopeptidase [Dokdonella sp.]|uniref:M3 family metallopeptidase n=2 Tax=Dokdonella sp. TaxID=2291710 RepID=UPI002BD76DE2|nr:M3 family metallopeptidase [Dokdonella sp.]HOX72632.1 M3 family metallopeptidase [Dokdonella sp.]